jgi:6-phosphogluconolactonase
MELPSSAEPDVVVLPDLSALAYEAAKRFARLARRSIGETGRFAVALAGGSTPRPLYELLATEPFRGQVPWHRVHLFWGDERCVPPDDPQSNYRMVREALLDGSTLLPDENVHRVPAERPPEEAAAAYEEALRAFFRCDDSFPRFDLVLLGMGPDGHTASLFPGGAALDETERSVVANWVPQQNAWRITLTYGALNAAHHIIFLVAGAGKAVTLREVLQPDSLRPPLPAQQVRPRAGTLTWLVDEAAASQLTAPLRS